MNDLNKKCMGEFPMFPGWLFFEEPNGADGVTVSAYGSQSRIIQASSPARESSIAKVLKEILSLYPPKNGS